MMYGFKVFDDSDWMGLQGCERFANGDEPAIGTIMIGEEECLVILDLRGITVHLDGIEYVLRIQVAREVLEKIANLIMPGAGFTHAEFKALGFEQI